MRKLATGEVRNIAAESE